ncbi:hypothetical protein [Acinetobacter pittii]|uniref:hypothetical protein n=1 Tax=Acinetobacter pittii TaxID=48296 RepID=UPI00083996F0|nr:hypothetical protein [Acinetobacter pittii]MCK0915059.1 hypothetical protein [Acinetobacter pittii]
MNIETITFTISVMTALLENEGVDINSVKINLKSGDLSDNLAEVNLIDLINAAKKHLAHIPQDSARLDFIMENRIRVEKWNTNPSTQYYFVMNEDDESIAKELDGRDAIDAAIKFFEEEYR